jgi:DNA-binding CsgD family transcriptional regulator
MARLNHSELRALSGALPERYAPGPYTDLPARETSEELDVKSLQTFGLTKREAEVLLWISQGKRNCEIAEILGARSRTIGKHVERILAKLCVETRTAAANMASEVLRLPLGNGSSA